LQEEQGSTMAAAATFFQQLAAFSTAVEADCSEIKV
jgi:hypothetical protein